LGLDFFILKGAFPNAHTPVRVNSRASWSTCDRNVIQYTLQRVNVESYFEVSEKTRTAA
jgi:hypothetical protein